MVVENEVSFTANTFTQHFTEDFKMQPVTFTDLAKMVEKIIAKDALLSPADKSLLPVLPSTVKHLPSRSTNLPELPLQLQGALERLTNDVFPYLNAQSISPNYYGFYIGGATPAATLADMLVPLYDQNLCLYLPKESIATELEVTAMNMLIDLFHLPRKEWAVGTAGSGGGHFTSGASGSNILGMALGREFVLGKAAERASGKALSIGQHGLLEVCRAANIDKVMVLCVMPHSTTPKALSLIGLGRSSIVSVAKHDNPTEIDIDRLRKLAATAKQDRIAYILSISAGEVNTGRNEVNSWSDMAEIRKICDEHDIWIHVDGAFGFYARILMNQPGTQEYSDLIESVRGLELADSITSDGHKMLNVPTGCGFFFTRHKHPAEQVFLNSNAAYIKTSKSDADHTQTSMNIGLENSKRFNALPVYLTLSAYGRAGHVDMVKRQIGLARRTVSWMWDSKDFELLPREESKEKALAKTFTVVLFQARNKNVNENLVQTVNSTRRMYISGTQWNGNPAARMAISNWQVDVERDFALVKDTLSGVVQQLTV